LPSGSAGATSDEDLRSLLLGKDTWTVTG